MKKAKSHDELKPLIELIKLGKLFDVQKWVSDGKPVNPPDPELKGRRTHGPLEHAMELSFHSMVEVLLRGGANFVERGPQDWTRFCAMTYAVNLKRMDLVELLIEYGGDVRDVPMLDVYETWDPSIMRYFIERGADPGQDLALASALSRRIRTALGIYKSYKNQYPHLDEQANIALRDHVLDGNKKWTSLMLWAGTDPYAVGKVDVERSDYSNECAIEIAIWQKLDWFFDFKQVHLHADKESAKSIFETACTSEYGDIFNRLIDADFHKKFSDEDVSEILTRIIRHMSYEPYEPYRYCNQQPISYDETHRRKPLLDTEYCTDGIQKFESLLLHGWKWFPALEDMPGLRRNILKFDGKYFVKILSLVREHKCASHRALYELIRTPTARARLQANKCNPDKYLESIDW